MVCCGFCGFDSIFLNLTQYVLIFLVTRAGNLTNFLSLFNLYVSPPDRIPFPSFHCFLTLTHLMVLMVGSNFFQAGSSSCIAPFTDLERLASGIYAPLIVSEVRLMPLLC